MPSKINQEERADLLQSGWNPKASSFKERELGGSHTCLPSASAFQLLRLHTLTLRNQVLFHITLTWQCQTPATRCWYRKLYSYLGFIPLLSFRLVPFSSWHQGKHAFRWQECQAIHQTWRAHYGSFLGGKDPWCPEDRTTEADESCRFAVCPLPLHMRALPLTPVRHSLGLSPCMSFFKV